MNNIKAIFTDIDGTLLTTNKIVDDNTIQALSKLKQLNISFGISTGRPVDNIKGLLNKWKINDLVDYIIGNNGAEVYDKHNDITYENHYLTKDDIKKIYNITKELNCSTVLYENDCILSNYKDEASINHANRVGYKHKCINYDEYINKSYPKVLLMTNKENHDEIINIIKTNTEYSIFPSSDKLLEIVDNRVNKSNGIKIIKDKLLLNTNNIVTFGDHLNDYEMIRDYYGVAMGNAIKEIKDISSYITDTNDESGIASFINKYIIK